MTGRPPRAGEAAKMRSFRAPDAEWATWWDAAEVAGKTLGDWIRDTLNHAARSKTK